MSDHVLIPDAPSLYPDGDKKGHVGAILAAKGPDTIELSFGGVAVKTLDLTLEQARNLAAELRFIANRVERTARAVQRNE